MIQVENLTIQVNKNTLVSDLNMHLERGQMWAILGKNGTGKTTLINTLAGFTPIHSGRVKIDNKSVSAYHHLLRAQKVAFLPQLSEISLNCTVAQSIAYARYPWHQFNPERQSEISLIDAAIDTMELQHLKNKSIQELSGGELKRVEIASVLAQDSESIMLDEPFNHLDLTFRFKIMQKLQQLSENKLIIIITHDIQYVQRYCSHVLMIMNKEQVLIGKTKQTLNEKNLIKMLGITEPNKLIYNLL